MLVFLFMATLPLCGQSQRVMEHMGYSHWGALLVYFGDDAKGVRSQFQNIMRTDELLEKNLRYMFLETASDNALTVRRELGINFGSKWALVSTKGFL
jgi:hypothetical protein